MRLTRTRLLIPLLLAPLVGCGEDKPSVTGERQAAPSVEFVMLLDDDSDPDQMHGRPGSYGITARGEPAPLAVVDVPDGYQNFGFFAMVPEGFGDDFEDPFWSVQYWTVHGVPRDPCRYEAPAPEVGPTLEDLADALVAQKRTEATKPRAVSLGGHDGLYLELTAPVDLDFATCRTGYFIGWEGKSGDSQHSVSAPGTVERVWILDVDGQRVLLDSSTEPGVIPEQVDELNQVIESTRFVDR